MTWKFHVEVGKNEIDFHGQLWKELQDTFVKGKKKKKLQNNMLNAIPFNNKTIHLEGHVKKYAILNNTDKQKESTIDQTSMLIREGMRSKQLPEVRRGGKSGVTVARAEEPQGSRQA